MQVTCARSFHHYQLPCTNASISWMLANKRRQKSQLIIISINNWNGKKYIHILSRCLAIHPTYLTVSWLPLVITHPHPQAPTPPHCLILVICEGAAQMSTPKGLSHIPQCRMLYACLRTPATFYLVFVPFLNVIWGSGCLLHTCIPSVLSTVTCSPSHTLAGWSWWLLSYLSTYKHVLKPYSAFIHSTYASLFRRHMLFYFNS